LDLREGIVL